MPTFDDLLAELGKLDQAGHTELQKATSLRIPAVLHRAVTIATDLGMAESFTAATTDALTDQVHAFARRKALVDHLGRFPQDEPDLDVVVRRRISGTDHAAVHDEQLTVDIARWYAEHHPDWATSGNVDEAVDHVLDLVEMLVARAESAVSA